MTLHKTYGTLILLVAAGAPSGVLEAQISATDYQRAEQLLGGNVDALVAHLQVSPRWFDGDRFWYRDGIFGGHEFVLVDPDANARRPAFDHARLAAALSVAADTAYEPHRLPFDEVEFVDGTGTIRFAVRDSIRWTCRITGTYACAGPDTIPDPSRGETPSPDGTWVAFARDYNLWVRHRETGEERQLSTDGEPWWDYAVNDQCCSQVTAPRTGQARPPVVRWSPDSRRIATHRLDRRGVEDLYLLETATGRPKLHTYRYALPGDSVIPTYDLYVFDVETAQGVRVDVPPQEAVNTSCCGLMNDSIWKDVHWGPNGRELFFTRGQRDFKRVELLAAAPETGTARSVLEETSPTFVELNLAFGLPNWRVLNDGRDVLWFSERDGWGHLYRYDARTGALRNQVTSGPWVVLTVVHVDEAAQRVYFVGLGREAGRDPYYRHLYRVGLDGTGLELLTPEDADHDVRVSPSGRYFVDTYSQRGAPPVTVVRGADGRVLQTVAEGDIAPLQSAGWMPPVPFTAKGRDGVTDVRGYLYFPPGMEEGRRYPVIDYVYPGPQTGPIGFRGFSPAPRGNGHALAQLGFIVFTIDAMGTPLRSKAFHDAYYGNMGDNGIPDHIAALRQLAMRYPQIDLDRVGIYGHSGGGFASTDAILRYPDFFEVAVSTAGNHDNRSYDYTWGEKYQGVLRRPHGEPDTFVSQANQELAANLQGKLLLMYGTLDDNVHPNGTLVVIDALIDHNKDFDLLVLPNRNHGYANEPYVVRRTWDYFVEHLLGQTPPAYRMRQEQGR